MVPEAIQLTEHGGGLLVANVISIQCIALEENEARRTTFVLTLD